MRTRGVIGWRTGAGGERDDRAVGHDELVRELGEGRGSSSGTARQWPERELDGRRGQGWRARQARLARRAAAAAAREGSGVGGRAWRGQAGEREGTESDGGRVARDETGPVKKEEEGGRRLTGPCRCAYAGSGRRTRTGEVEAAVLR